MQFSLENHLLPTLSFIARVTIYYKKQSFLSLKQGRMKKLYKYTSLNNMQRMPQYLPVPNKERGISLLEILGRQYTERAEVICINFAVEQAKSSRQLIDFFSILFVLFGERLRVLEFLIEGVWK